MFLTWAHFWTKYQFASDMILGISQLLCQVKHSVTKVDRHHPKSEVGIFYISMECLFPEICPFLWNILSPVTAAWLLPTKEGWPILLRLLRSPYSAVLPLSLQVLPLISHFCFFFTGGRTRDYHLPALSLRHKRTSYSAGYCLYEPCLLMAQNDPSNSIVTAKEERKEKKLCCTFKTLFPFTCVLAV